MWSGMLTVVFKFKSGDKALTYYGMWQHKPGSSLAQVLPGNTDLSSIRSIDIHLRTISQEIPQPSVTKINLKITFLGFHSNLPGANKFNSFLALCICFWTVIFFIKWVYLKFHSEALLSTSSGCGNPARKDKFLWSMLRCMWCWIG